MQNNNSWFIAIVVFTLASCGGGGSSTPTNTVEPDPIVTPDPIDGGGDSGSTGSGGTNVGVSTPDDLEKYADGDLSGRLYADEMRTTNAGASFRLSEIEENYGLSIYREDISGAQRAYGHAMDGDNVDVAIVGYYRSSTGTGNTDYFVRGDLMPESNQPRAIYNYSGWFVSAAPGDTDSKLMATEMLYQIDFATGDFSGYDFPEQALVLIDGDVNGNKISGVVQYFYGQNSFDGAIFGDGAQEIAGGFQNGPISAVFYGEKN